MQRAWEKKELSGGNSACEGPEVRKSLTCRRQVLNAHVSGMELDTVHGPKRQKQGQAGLLGLNEGG
jgi:hypothetical protein